MWQSMPTTFEARQRRGAAVAGQRLVVGDAELVVLQAGRDVGVGPGVDVGIDAQADLRRATGGHRRARQQLQLRPALSTLKQRTPAIKRPLHFGARLADAREHHLRGVAAGRQHALEFAAGDDVEAAAGLGEGLQHGQAGVGLHGVAEQMRRGRPGRAGRRRRRRSMARCEYTYSGVPKSRASASSEQPSSCRSLPWRARKGAPGRLIAAPRPKRPLQARPTPHWPGTWPHSAAAAGPSGHSRLPGQPGPTAASGPSGRGAAHAGPSGLHSISTLHACSEFYRP